MAALDDQLPLRRRATPLRFPRVLRRLPPPQRQLGTQKVAGQVGVVRLVIPGAGTVPRQADQRDNGEEQDGSKSPGRQQAIRKPPLNGLAAHQQDGKGGDDDVHLRGDEQGRARDERRRRERPRQSLAARR